MSYDLQCYLSVLTLMYMFLWWAVNGIHLPETRCYWCERYMIRESNAILGLQYQNDRLKNEILLMQQRLRG